MRFVGEAIRRREDPALITGRSRFIADLTVGCNAVAFVRSPMAAGRIRGIEVPNDARVFTVAQLGDVGFTGAKGLGEGGAIGAPAAVINAVSDALRALGVGFAEMPATPSRIRDRIRLAMGGAA